MLSLRTPPAEPLEVTVRTHGVSLRTRTATFDLPIRPDARRARQLTACARRCDQVDIVVQGDTGHGVLSATWHRLPHRRTIPLGAALALAVMGVPAFLVKDGQS